MKGDSSVAEESMGRCSRLRALLAAQDLTLPSREAQEDEHDAEPERSFSEGQVAVITTV